MSHISTRKIDTPVGPLHLGADEVGLCMVGFSDKPIERQEECSTGKKLRMSVKRGNNSILDQAEQQLIEYFKGDRTEFRVPLSMQGTEFQQLVWNELLNIPYGETASYGEVAERIKKPNAQRAVGAANGANPVSIIVPCHRVVNSNGKLHGYGGGLWRKKHLLDLEAETVSLPQ